MATVRHDFGAELVFPQVVGNPLFEAASSGAATDEGVVLACLPQTFLANVSGHPDALRQSCRDALQAEWRKIGKSVHDELSKRWNPHWPGWDDGWQQQIDHFWDIRVVVLLDGQPETMTLKRLWGEQPLAGDFQQRREYLARIAAADKNIRHYPPHEFNGSGEGDTRPKCSLLGSFAQMGPLAPLGRAQMSASREFWASVLDDQRQRDPIAGIRLGQRDRFCAISLVRRFALGTYFKPNFGNRFAEFDFPDVDTICAGQWLVDATH